MRASRRQLLERIAELEAELEALQVEPERPVWPKMPPPYHLSDELVADDLWRARVEDYSAGSIYEFDEFGGYL